MKEIKENIKLELKNVARFLYTYNNSELRELVINRLEVLLASSNDPNGLNLEKFCEEYCNLRK